MNLNRLMARILHAIADELDPPPEPAPPDEPVPPHTWNADPPLVTYAEASPDVDSDRPGFHL